MKTRVELKLGGKTYRLLPGGRALERVAEEVGDPVQLSIAMGLAAQVQNTPPIKTCVQVLHIGLVESGYDIERDELWRLVFEEGVAVVYEPFAAFVGALVNKGEVPEDEADDQGEEIEPRNRKERRAKKARARKSKSKT